MNMMRENDRYDDEYWSIQLGIMMNKRKNNYEHE